MYSNKNRSTIWEKIVGLENEVFSTKTGIQYTYEVYDEYVLINNDKKRKITKEMFEKALLINNPSPSKFNQADIWGPSYVYGIITDSRIKNDINF